MARRVKRLCLGSLILSVLCLIFIYLTESNQSNSPRFHNATQSIIKKSHERTRPITTPAAVTSIGGRRTSLLQPCSTYVVPNIVHFIWFGEFLPMKFHHMLSILSVYKLMKPEQIWLHCDYEPIGEWWRYLQKHTNNSLKILKRKPPTSIFKNRIWHPEHSADVARLEILHEHGGIYIDTDVIVLKSFDSLRKYEMTMGIEYHGNPGRLNNGILVARKNATFLRIWYGMYRNFSGREWDTHSCKLPYNLQFLYPHLIHVEEKTLNYPSGRDMRLIYDEVYDWSKNYAIHLWHRLYERGSSHVTIRHLNTTFGQIARYVYYGSPGLLGSPPNERRHK